MVDMMEFAINSSISASMGYAPFELNGGYMPQIMTELRNPETTNEGIKEFMGRALMHLAAAHNAIIEARTFQTFHANQQQREDPLVAKGDLVYLSTKNLNLPKNHARKLYPKYVGPYKVTETIPGKSVY